MFNSFEVLRSIHSNIESSEQFRRQNSFSICYRSFLHVKYIGTNNWNVETYKNRLENIFGLVDSNSLPSLGPHVHMMAPNLRKRSKLGINKYFFFILRTSSGRCRHYRFVYFYHHSLNYVTWNLHVFLMYVKELLWYELDAVGSWQIILPMPNLERPY